ncbi:family 1 glycosylhydrolase [Bacillus licheniformis]|nr:family 1 glycosylhydrolase [Bacillus licheniformis]
MHRAIQEGANVKGYHLWTFMDNWSWTNAYKTATDLYLSTLTKRRTND